MKTRRQVLIAVATFALTLAVGGESAQSRGVPLRDVLKYVRPGRALRSDRNCPENQKCEPGLFSLILVPFAIGFSWLIANIVHAVKNLFVKPAPPPDPIQEELDRLAEEVWLANHGQSAQKWEVFRSGAQGPYTREEMRTVQKITARTNVRRVGEPKWTRAGEIPELSDVLS
jgi:GYF domain 2